MTILQRTLLLGCLLLPAAATAVAQNLYQVETRPVRGFMPNMDQISSPIDHIDPVSRKLHLEIPMASLPRGRGGSGFDLSLVYDSNFWDLTPVVLPPPSGFIEPAAGHTLFGAWSGWELNIDNLGIDFEEQVQAAEYTPQCQTPLPRLYRLRARLMDGSLHVLHLKGYGVNLGGAAYDGDGFFPVDTAGRHWCWNGQQSHMIQVTTAPLIYFSTDGSYLKLEIPSDRQSQILYFPDGRRVVFDAQGKHLYDANGNGVHVLNTCFDPPPGPCNQPYKAIRDDVGREIRVVETFGGPSVKTTTITVTGPNGEIDWTLNWGPLQLGADGRRYTRAYPDAGWDTTYPLSKTLMVLQYVQLPLASPMPPGPMVPVWNSYAFGYSDDSDGGYGQLDEVRVPTGAFYRYRYDLEGSSSSVRAADIAAIDPFVPNGVWERRIAQQGQVDLIWTYLDIPGPPGLRTRVTAPDMSQTVYWYAPDLPYLDQSIPSNSNVGFVVYKIEEPHGRVQKRVWSQNRVYSSAPSGPFIQNPWVKRETVTVGDSFDQPSKTMVTEHVIDKNGNPRETLENDWVGYSQTGPEPPGVQKRRTVLTYWVDVDAYNLSGNDTGPYYFNSHGSPFVPGQARRLDALRRREIRDGMNGAIVAVTEFTYDDPYRSGNVTVESRWDSVKSPGAPGLGGLFNWNSQVLTRFYGAYGNLRDIYDPEVRTHISYDPTGSFPTRVDHAYGTSAQRSWIYEWDTVAGTLSWKRDDDNSLTTYFSYDQVGRLESVQEAGMRRILTEYDDAASTVTVRRDLTSHNDGAFVTVTEYDQLGRPKLVRTSEGGGNEIKVKTVYHTSENRTIRSTPYRTLGDQTLEWICTQSDALQRVTAVAMFKGAGEPFNCESGNRTGITRTAYNADWMTVTDPAGKVRELRRDSLGRLVEVFEDRFGLNYLTMYSYDTLDNLTQVLQDMQTRTFRYSSLSRLLSATNPETGTFNCPGLPVPVSVCYGYNDSGNLTSRKDARGVTAGLNYDPLHRIQTKTYSDGTPAVTFSYYLAGQGAPRVGQLKSVISSAAETWNDSYDVLGRVTASRQIINGNPATYNFNYTWWLNDAIRSITNPSNRMINYDVDAAGRTSRVWAAAKVYADMTVASTPYTPDGRLAQMKLGNNLWETREYQTPGLTTLFKLGTAAGLNNKFQLEYNFSGTNNNGNLQSHVIRQPGKTWTQTYAYDNVNRLSSAIESGGWWQTYGYDRFGNRWVSGSGNMQFADPHEATGPANINGSTNQLFVNGSWYDAAGNQRYFAPYTLDYDAENRIISTFYSDTDKTTFAYDGNGGRVKKARTSGANLTTTYFVYNALGQLAAEYSTQAATPGTTYVHTDMLGSTRMVTNQNGAAVECYDYTPFGRLITSGMNTRNTGCYPPDLNSQFTSKLAQKFTGKERDPESGLDWFGTRYLSSAQGRFTSPDKPFADQDPLDPQSWNLYSYTRNNPLKYVDRHGAAIETPWDLFNVGLDLFSLGSNLVSGNFASAAVDAGGLLYDVGATLIPGLPGGAGTAIRAGRLADRAADAVQAATSVKRLDNAADAATTGAKVIDDAPVATTPYKRPSSATTPEQRASVQGKPCVDCGRTAPRMNADHKTPLVKEHYETGKVDTTRMRQANAVQSQCPTCSSRQGAELSRYSREQRKRLEKEQQPK